MKRILSCHWWVLLTAVIPLASMPTTVRADEFVTQIAAGADDAKVYGTFMELGATDALVGYTGYYRCDYAARFGSVAVPQGATIDSAFVLLRVSSSQSGTVCSAWIRAEDTASADPFSTYADYAARHSGECVVAWDNIPPMISATWQRTPDIAAAVGEIIARPDWVSGNPLAVFLCDNNSSSGANRRFSQFEANSAYACSLFVYYSTGPVPEQRRIFRRRSLLINPLAERMGDTCLNSPACLADKEER
jgi:hypothetical protein